MKKKGMKKKGMKKKITIMIILTALMILGTMASVLGAEILSINQDIPRVKSKVVDGVHLNSEDGSFNFVYTKVTQKGSLNCVLDKRSSRFSHSPGYVTQMGSQCEVNDYIAFMFASDVSNTDPLKRAGDVMFDELWRKTTTSDMPSTKGYWILDRQYDYFYECHKCEVTMPDDFEKGCLTTDKSMCVQKGDSRCDVWYEVEKTCLQHRKLQCYYCANINTEEVKMKFVDYCFDDRFTPAERNNVGVSTDRNDINIICKKPYVPPVVPPVTPPEGNLDCATNLDCEASEECKANMCEAIPEPQVCTENCPPPGTGAECESDLKCSDGTLIKSCLNGYWGTVKNIECSSGATPDCNSALYCPDGSVYKECVSGKLSEAKSTCDTIPPCTEDLVCENEIILRECLDSGDYKVINENCDASTWYNKVWNWLKNLFAF